MRNQAPIDFVEKYYTDDLAERNSPESVWALSWLTEVKGNSILSLGCGPNFYDDAQFFANIPKEFVGIDINENNILFLKNTTHPEVIRCKEILNKNHTKIYLEVADVRKKQKNFINRFDSIYANGMLGMFAQKDLTEILTLICSYLKPGGLLIDVDWTDTYLPKEKLKERASYEWYSTQGPDVKRIGKLMQETGFEIMRHKVFHVPNPAEYSWGTIYGYVAKRK